MSRTVPSPMLLGYGIKKTKKPCKLQSAAAQTVQSLVPPLGFCINILMSLVLCHYLVWRISCLSWRSPVQPPQVTFPQLAEPCRSQQSWISGWLSVYSQHPEGQIAQTLHPPWCLRNICECPLMDGYKSLCLKSNELPERTSAQREENRIPRLRLACEEIRLPCQYHKALSIPFHLQVRMPA